MTIQRTRELLKDKVAHLTDNEILEFINKSEKSIDAFMQTIVKNNSLQNIEKGVIN